MARQVKKSGTSVIVYDDSIVSHLSPEMFTAGYWSDAEVVPGYSGGRGETLCVQHDGDDWVLKHYHRGGFVGRWLNDGFPWLSETRVRSVAEWRVLQDVVALGLPAPIPVAAHYRRQGLLYTADLITRRIPDVTPYSTRMEQGAIDNSVWWQVGKCIGDFHAAGFFHADLSSHNLQISTENQIYLLDWDRGEYRSSGSWKAQNLARLERSCQKVSRDGSAHFSSENWSALLQGYAKSI